MREFLDEAAKPKNKPKCAKRAQTSDFERNATRLRSKERKLDAKKPVKTVSPN